MGEEWLHPTGYSISQVIDDQAGTAMGNVVGSNVFNILGVLGLTGLLAPSGIAASEVMLGFDIPVMIVVALACLPICFTGGVINRWEGGVLLAYTLYLILAATQHDALLVVDCSLEEVPREPA